MTTENYVYTAYKLSEASLRSYWSMISTKRKLHDWLCITFSAAQVALTKLSVIAAPCVNYDMILETSWLYAVNFNINWKLWTITSQITQELSLDLVEKLLEASVHLAESTLKTLVNDHSELTQALVMTPLSSSVHDHLKQSSALVKYISKSLVHDPSEIHFNLVMISLKVLEDFKNYVLDLDAVNYTDYLNDEFFFLMYSHCLTEKKVTFVIISVFFNISKLLVTDEDWVISKVYQKFVKVFFKDKAETLL